MGRIRHSLLDKGIAGSDLDASELPGLDEEHTQTHKEFLITTLLRDLPAGKLGACQFLAESKQGPFHLTCQSLSWQKSST